MSNPYALDFNPLAQAFQNKAQVDLARNRLAMDEERLGFERDQHPLRMQGLQLSNDAAALGYDTAQKTQGYTIEQARLANQQTRGAITQQGLQSTQLRQQIEDHTAKQFGGVMQIIGDRLKADPNDQWALNEYKRVLGVKDYQPTFQKWGISEKDPVTGAQILIARGRGFQDPMAAQAKQAEIDKDKAQAQLFTSQAEAGNYIPLPENSRGVLDKKKGVIIGADTHDGTQRKFDEGYAKEQAPKLYTEASGRYKTAADTHQTLGAIEELAPYAATGFQGPLPPEVALKARKIAGSLGLPGSEKIGPTELFHFLTQKGVFDIVSKMKPATDLDMQAARDASLSIKTDPSTFVYAVPVLKRVQERTMLIEELEMQELRKGRPADPKTIMREVNARLPLVNMKGQAGQIDGTASGPQASKAVTDRLPQPGQAPSITPTQEQLLNVPDGTRVGQYVIRGGKAYLAPPDAPGAGQAPQVAPNMLPPGVAPELPAGYPAQRVQMRRAQEQTQADTQRAQQRAQVQSQFENDVRTLPPVDVARKYDGMRSLLDQRQLLQLNEAINRMTRR